MHCKKTGQKEDAGRKRNVHTHSQKVNDDTMFGRLLQVGNLGHTEKLKIFG